MKKMPPIEKIPEAYSAIVDGRVEMDVEKAMAHIYSSDRTKAYTVTWNENVYTSNDNASYWKNAIGYPIIAVLLLQGKLPVNMEIINLFKNINWKSVNTRYKNKYDDALAEVFHTLAMKGVDLLPVQENLDNVYDDLEKLPVRTKRSAFRPPV
ncbi:MAG: hypothetical protein RR346_05820 [Bacteroidales bacterium]